MFCECFFFNLRILEEGEQSFEDEESSCRRIAEGITGRPGERC